MTDVEKIRLQKWWQEQLRELTRKVMAQEEKRQQAAKKKAMAMFGDLAIERREDIDDLYAYGTITEKKRDKLIDLWEQGEQNDWFYDEKINLLQDAYTESMNVVRDLQAQQ
jgi:hypothetical protein